MRLIPRLGSRKTKTSRRPATAKLRLDTLEDRALPSFGFGSAVGVGGAGSDSANSIVLDAAGSTYVSGWYNNTVDFDPNGTNPTSNHVLTATPNGALGDVVVAKYLADGTFQWASDLGAGYGLKIAVQGSGVYVPYVSEVVGSTGGYVSRLDAAIGAVTWTTLMTATGDADAVAVGPAGSLYADGFSGGSASQGIVDRLDPTTGSILWTRTSSGASVSAKRLAVDSAGNAYATGTFNGTATFGSTSLTSYPGTSDTFVWKLSAGGGTVWAGNMGSSGGTGSWGITTDTSGNAYVTGTWMAGTNNFNPASGKAVSLTHTVSYSDVFVVKLSPGKNGAMALGWAKDIGGNSSSSLTQGNDVAVDGSGNVYTTGYFTGPTNFNPNSGTKHILAGYGAGDIFVSKLDANGNYVAAAQLGGATGAIGNSIVLDGSGNVYVTGHFGGTANFSPNGRDNLTSNGSDDIFVSVLTQTLTPGAMAPSGPSTDASTPIVTAANGSLSPIGPAIALPVTAAPVAPDQIDWFAAAAGRKRSALFADWLETGENA